MKFSERLKTDLAVKVLGSSFDFEIDKKRDRCQILKLDCGTVIMVAGTRDNVSRIIQMHGGKQVR